MTSASRQRCDGKLLRLEHMFSPFILAVPYYELCLLYAIVLY